MADWQQDEVYTWEWKFRHWGMRMQKGVREARVWIKWACRRYAVEPPTVRVVSKLKGTAQAIYDSGEHQITLKRAHLNCTTELHEAAHAIAFKLTGKLNHGKVWLGIYIDLLVAAKVAPRIALEASAEEDGLRYLPRANPKRVKRYLKKKAQRRKAR